MQYNLEVKMKAITSFRIEQDTFDDLKKIANETNRTVSNVMQTMLDNGIELYKAKDTLSLKPKTTTTLIPEHIVRVEWPMPTDNSTNVSFKLSTKSLSNVDKLAAIWGLSRGNTLMSLVEEALTMHGEVLENNRAFTNGKRDRNGVSRLVNNQLRKIL